MQKQYPEVYSLEESLAILKKCEPHLLIEVGASLLKPTNVS
ncbi:hypothetical protein [Campylobacter coli]|nr:hypothetical protein [Campylobacter coli]